MDTWGTDSVRSDHSPITCSISTETRAKRRPNRTRCVVDWRPAPEWENEMEKVWEWNRPTGVLEIWRDLAATPQIPHGDRYLQGYEDDLDVLVNVSRKKRQKRQRPTTPLQSGLAQETCLTTPPGQKAKAGTLRGASTSRQAQVETSHLGEHLLEYGCSEKLSLISTAPSLSFQTLCIVRHYERPRTKI